ncbi:hypothetical protein TTHERM_000455691 (macronuclear) [Tetrahymena thermophila SB210]|uniref:Uncharacterized protein n=1 Tax=Tetrahymena thermophila (strain SB210) TaxID=312017 RepID=W7X6I9_TETTS|nr:hypothetical protein TTHERM_000455691 [Tetrahymena thermophila SB210]EWS71978.1 hypothetical protein TTHERM_000455691 [Tetrahymena thermophila SB210]|eukprot:XP_012655478.1 hypothetical protein TTHERM_000455691 [Tetrahymena thermophila SB210]
MMKKLCKKMKKQNKNNSNMKNQIAFINYQLNEILNDINKRRQFLEQNKYQIIDEEYRKDGLIFNFNTKNGSALKIMILHRKQQLQENMMKILSYQKNLKYQSQKVIKNSLRNN